MTPEQRSRILAESPVHGAALLAELDEMLGVFRVANRYNARHDDFTPCDEIRYYQSVQDIIARTP